MCISSFPDHMERIIWGDGDGPDLGDVDTTVGRVGSLICWKHLNCCQAGIHAEDEPTHVIACDRGRCFVLAVGQYLNTDDDRPSERSSCFGRVWAAMFRLPTSCLVAGIVS